MTMAPKGSLSGYRFDDITLDIDRRRVTRGNTRVQVGKLTYELLLVLAEAAPRVVTQEELVEQLWGRRVVSAEALKQRVRLLRQALSDDAGHPRYIEVVRGQGYRLIPDVEPLTADTPSPVWKRPSLLAPVGVLAAVIGIYLGYPDPLETRAIDVLPNSVAVLPFENLSPDPNDSYFATGIHEEVLNQLVKLGSLNVIAEALVQQYADGETAIRDIARQLKVETVMKGSVRYAGDRVRISAELIDPDSGTQLWSRTYDREFADIFAIESDIAISVANALKAKFSLEERANIARAPTDSPEAHKLNLRGRQLWNFRTDEAVERALDLFQQAVEVDPNYAVAYSGIGDVWLARGWYSILAPKEAYPNAIVALTKALAIDQTLAEAHATRAHIYLEFDYDWAAAESGYLRAIELNPRYASAHHWYGGYLSAMERHDEALSQAHQARDLNPLSPIINTWVGLRHYFAGDYPMAIQEIQKALELKPDFAPGHWHLGWAFEQAGQHNAAIASAERAIAISNNPLYLTSLGHAHAKAGNDEEAREILDRLEQTSVTRHVSAYHTAVIHAALGDLNESFRWLDDAFAEQSPWIGYMRVDPRLDSLRSDSRFDTLLRQVRLN